MKEPRKKRVHPLVGTEERRRSYGVTWDKMLLAVANGFFVEAISLQENIITDKLAAYLNLVHDKKVDSNSSLKKIIDTWKKLYPEPISVSKVANLQEATDQWRARRNGAIHHRLNMVAEEYSALEKETALIGKQLVSALSAWCVKEVRRRKKDSRRVGQRRRPGVQSEESR